VARDVGASTYDERMPTNRNRLEIPPTLDALDAQADDVVAELGCGTGRMTVLFLETVRHVVAVDFSVASLVRLRDRVSPKLREKLFLVHADVARPPLAKGAFSKVASFQVLEHLPSAEERQKCIVAARQLLRQGTGTLTLSVYNWSMWKQYDAKRGRGDNSKKEGHHSTTPPIYYYNFEDRELRELLEGSGFAVQKMRGLILQVPGLLALGRFGAPIHHALAETRFGLRNGHLLLAKAKAKG
jgi:SAM-dependent methyltransferase